MDKTVEQQIEENNRIHLQQAVDRSNISKYRVDPDDRIDVEIWIEIEEDNFKVLSSSCVFMQGKNPCNGDPTQPCGRKYEDCNNYSKDLCTDEVGRIKFFAKQEEKQIPKNFKKEWAKFARESWAVRSYIEANSFKTDKNTQERVFDAHRQQFLIVQCLLKEWSLGVDDEQLVIQHCSMPGLPFTMIQEDQMKRISEVSGEVMRALIEGFIKKSRTVE